MENTYIGNVKSECQFRRKIIDMKIKALLENHRDDIYNDMFLSRLYFVNIQHDR